MHSKFSILLEHTTSTSSSVRGFRPNYFLVLLRTNLHVERRSIAKTRAVIPRHDLAQERPAANEMATAAIDSFFDVVEQPTRLFIIDPQPLIAAGLQHFFNATNGFIVSQTAQQLRLATLRTIRPDVLLLSFEHGSDEVCNAIATAKAAVPSAKICLLSCHTHPERLPRVLAAGASGYAIKDVAPGELVRALRAIARGSIYVDPRLIDAPRKPSTRHATHLNALSERETEIVKLIAEGCSNREISAQLGLSEKTIKNHISRIFSKLHITARTQAVMHAIKTGIA
jgi:DNA-binding NarL/FixJ family response regulator